jgi:3alpha(or 20beta)-hydroxysteroid dehydrogenase
VSSTVSSTTPASLGGVWTAIRFDAAQWRALLDVNLEGPFLGCASVVPQMVELGNGSIVNVSSIAGFRAPPFGHVGYAASKGGLRLLTKAVTVRAAGNPLQLRASWFGVTGGYVVRA